MRSNIAIIGGGWTGLTAAYRLSQAGHRVTVLEKNPSLGGLAGGFQINGANLEKAYHHIFKTDKDIIGLVGELGLEDKLEWHEGGTAVYYKKGIYPFTTPGDLLRFPHLGLTDKVRMGLTALFLQKDKNWQKYIDQKAWEWMKRWCGHRAYEVIWEPLLRGKFHDYHDKVSMAWLWARIHTRGNSKEKGEVSEKLGYFNGGFNVVTEALQKAIVKKGGKIKTGVTVSRIEPENGKVEISVDGKTETYDKVIACIPSGALAALISHKNNREYIKKLKSVDYLGAIIIVFTTPQSLSRYYWHNINDTESPFLAFIQHTNFIDKKKYGNEEVYYLGTYLPHEHKYFALPNDKLASIFFKYLRKVFPDFETSKVTKNFVFKLKNAQHIVDTRYPEKIPAYETPLPNVYLANFSQIFPEDRGTNFAVREGNKIARMVME